MEMKRWEKKKKVDGANKEVGWREDRDVRGGGREGQRRWRRRRDEEAVEKERAATQTAS